EQTILALSGRIATLENTLGNKVSTDITYKIQSVDKDGCIGLDGNPLRPSLVGCDHPDAWKMVAGPPVKKPEKAASPPTPEPQAGKNRGTRAPPQKQRAGRKHAVPCRRFEWVLWGTKQVIGEGKSKKKKGKKK